MKNTEQFEKAYIAVRDKEGRILSDEQVARLPLVNSENPHFKEWQIRHNSAQKVLNYVKQCSFDDSDQLLDIGCGNGWFSDALAKTVEANVLAIDINNTELEQAARVFKRDNLNFAYLDLACEKPTQRFKQIFFNSCFQYFPDPKAIIDLCLTLLDEGGEIHILDSPFYQPSQVTAAKERSREYYTQLDADQMTAFYHHHSLALLDQYQVQWLYQPPPKSERTGPMSPFPWLKICK